jgi:hypothetical protein
MHSVLNCNKWLMDLWARHDDRGDVQVECTLLAPRSSCLASTIAVVCLLPREMLPNGMDLAQVAKAWMVPRWQCSTEHNELWQLHDVHDATCPSSTTCWFRG